MTLAMSGVISPDLMTLKRPGRRTTMVALAAGKVDFQRQPQLPRFLVQLSNELVAFHPPTPEADIRTKMYDRQ